mmetsp:Transcript_28053/g.39955  ORF Transcript_28053/g.39955 Transcript_28053/m.39955 type:complete len:426 (-) Transcript_28053:282-1559(-)
MCRLTAYKGPPILIGDVINKPNNSLLCQSRDAAYHPGVIDKSNERNIIVNGDGFGLAWYAEPESISSCTFRFVTPAWSNSNLRNIGDHVKSHLFFAHIRAASSGHDPQEEIHVSVENCHPFKFGSFSFMHNGGIPHFRNIRLSLLNLLSERSFHMIKGNTDTEHIFALFLDFMPEGSTSLDDMVVAINQTISTILAICALAEIEQPCSLNLCVTNGKDIIATRYRNGPENPPSLYFIYGSQFVCRDGRFCSVQDHQRASSVVISSAPLSRVHQLSSTDHLLNHPQENILESSSTNYKKKKSLNNNSIIMEMATKQDQEEEFNEVDLSVDDDDFIFEPDKDNYSKTDVNKGAWTLIPKDHILICKGDVVYPNQVSSISLEPVKITNPFNCKKTMALFRKRTKEKLLVCKTNGSRSGNLPTKLRSKL